MAENAKLTYWIQNQNISRTPEAEIILGRHVEAFGMDKRSADGAEGKIMAVEVTNEACRA